jgi:twitching motility two-component system response regulator PilG
MNTAAPAIADTPAVKLLVKGFNAMERRLLEGTVKLSQRKAPRIDLVADDDAADADVVMIDAHDPQALHWANSQPWLATKPAIWAGAKSVRTQHTVVERHVKWPILPVLLYRAIEQAQGTPPAAAAPAPTEAPEHAATKGRVLVVDDSLAARNYLCSMLERFGIEVVTAETAEEGIRYATTAPFGCVLLDVLMPGIDGFEACRRIKGKRSQLPVVMLTSKSSPFDRVRGKMAGCDTYLTKPVDPVQLREVVARHVPLGAAPAARPRGTPSGFAPLLNANT